MAKSSPTPKTAQASEQSPAWTPTPPAELWRLTPEIVDLATAAAPDETALADACAREGLGGRPVARLLIAAAAAEKHYAAIAATEEHVRAELAEADRRVHGPMPMTAEGDEIRRNWGRLMNAAAEVDRAIGCLAYLRQQFPALFGKQPELLRGKPCVLGDCPPELEQWFAGYDLAPKQFACWTTTGRQAAPPAPKRRIVSM